LVWAAVRVRLGSLRKAEKASLTAVRSRPTRLRMKAGQAAEVAVEGEQLVLALADVGAQEQALELVEVGGS
jgi:hypothetical protein